MLRLATLRASETFFAGAPVVAAAARRALRPRGFSAFSAKLVSA